MATFPLIRAGAIVPFMRWMHDNGRPLGAALRTADLIVAPWEEPDRPMALRNALAVLRALERSEGADIGCRVVSVASIAELAGIGRVLLGAATPREAMQRAAGVMPCHSTHEQVTVTQVSGGVELREQMTLGVEPATLHVEQQYVASIVRALCLATGCGGEPLARVELQPHPKLGIAHLHEHLGPSVAAARTRALSIFIPDAVLDRPFPTRAHERHAPPRDWRALRGDGSFKGTARIYVETMLEDGAPSIQRLCAAAGLSRRTLQRRLGAEGTSYSALLDDARRDEAMKALGGSVLPMGRIASDLGYSAQPSFSRAVRRWTALAPRSVRRSAGIVGE